MPKVFTEYAVTTAGIIRREVREDAVQLEDSITEAFSAGLVRRVEHLLLYGGNFGNVALAADQPGYSAFSIEIRTLPLRCHCNTENGVVVPVFDNKECPLLPMRWTPPNGMRLILGVEVQRRDGYGYAGSNQYLVAFDSDGRTYRLPLSNLFEDCKLCHNLNPTNEKVALEVIRKACEQFERSHWNDHLYKDASTETRQRTKQLFRWKPTNETFEQLPPELPAGKDWRHLCTKIAVDRINHIIIPTTP